MAMLLTRIHTYERHRNRISGKPRNTHRIMALACATRMLTLQYVRYI